MGYLHLAAAAGLGSSGLGLSANPLAPILMALALCAFGYALSMLLRSTEHCGRHLQEKEERQRAAERAEAEAEAASAAAKEKDPA